MNLNLEGADKLAKEGEKLARESLLELVDLDGFMNKVRRGDVDGVKQALDGDFALQSLGGADVVDESGHRPMHYAVAEGKLSMIKLLIERRADVSAPAENDKTTPLHFAVKFQHLQTCQLLVRYGVDTKARDESGRTALSYASTHPIYHAVKHGDTVNDYIIEVDRHLKKMYAARKAVVRRPIRDESKKVAKAYMDWWNEVSDHNNEHNDTVPLPPKLGNVTIHNTMKASVEKPPTVGLYIFAGDEAWNLPLKGMLRFSYTTFKDTPAVLIDDIFVDKNLRRNKIGAALITHMIITVHRGPKRISFIYVVLDDTQEWAIDFFSALSFAILNPMHVPKPLRKQGMVVMAMKRCELELLKIAKVLHDKRLDEPEDLSDTERDRRAAAEHAVQEKKQLKAWEKKWQQVAVSDVPRMRPLEAIPLPPPELKLSEMEDDVATKRRVSSLEKKAADRAGRPFICENDRVPLEALNLHREEIRSNRQISEWRHAMQQREPRNRSKVLGLTRALRSAWMAALEREESRLAMPEGWVYDTPPNGRPPRFLNTITGKVRAKRPRLHFQEEDEEEGGERRRDGEGEGNAEEEARDEQARREGAFSAEVVEKKRAAGNAERRREVKERKEWLAEREEIIAEAQRGKWSEELMAEHLASKFGEETKKTRETAAAYRLLLQQTESVRHNYKLAAEHTHKPRVQPDPAAPAGVDASATVSAGNFGSPPNSRPTTASSPQRHALSSASSPSRLRPHSAAPSSPTRPPLEPAPSSRPASSLRNLKPASASPATAVDEWVGRAQEREAALEHADSLLDLFAPPPRAQSAQAPPSPELQLQVASGVPVGGPRLQSQAPVTSLVTLGSGATTAGFDGGEARGALRAQGSRAATPTHEATRRGEPTGREGDDDHDDGSRPPTAASQATTVGAGAGPRAASGSSRRRKAEREGGSRPPSAGSALSVGSCVWSRPPSRDPRGQEALLSRPPSALWSDVPSRTPSRDSSLSLLPSRGSSAAVGRPAQPATVSVERWSRPDSGVTVSSLGGGEVETVAGAVWSRPSSGLPPQHQQHTASAGTNRRPVAENSLRPASAAVVLPAPILRPSTAATHSLSRGQGLRPSTGLPRPSRN